MCSYDDSEIQLVLAERAITKVLHSYCQTLDRRDWSGLESCYHEDAVDSHGAFLGTAAELITWLRSRHDNVLSSMHVLTNISIDLADDGRSARAESYCLSHQVVDPSSGDPFAGSGYQPVFMVVGCRYVDDFALRPNTGWRIARRTVAFEWMRRNDMGDFLPVDPSWVVSRRDRSDVLYGPSGVAADP